MKGKSSGTANLKLSLEKRDPLITQMGRKNFVDLNDSTKPKAISYSPEPRKLQKKKKKKKPLTFFSQRAPSNNQGSKNLVVIVERTGLCFFDHNTTKENFSFHSQRRIEVSLFE